MILDGNKLAEGHAFFSIGATEITDDGRWLAYTTDTTGFRQYTLHIKDLATGEILRRRWSGWARWRGRPITARCSIPSKTRNRSGSISYGAMCSATDHSEDVLVYQDDDERFNLGAGRTRDGKFLVMESASHTTTECRVLAAEEPRASSAHLPARR